MSRKTSTAATRGAAAKAATPKPADTKGADPKPPVAQTKVAEAVAEETVKVPEPLCASARIQKGRPHPSLLKVIETKGTHPGQAFRIRRWDRYTVGMSVLHCRITEGLDHLDIGFYVKHGLMTLRDMTDAEKADALKRWDGEAVPAQPAAEAATEAAAS